jgi:hypothetical protein
MLSLEVSADLASNVHRFHAMKLFVPSALTALLSLASTALCAVGCSSPTQSEFSSEPPKADAEALPGSLLPEAGTGTSADAAPSSCPPAIPATFAPVWKAPAKAAACTTDELTGYFDACLKDPSTSEANGSCASWKAAHAACGACAEPTDNSGPIQWQLGRKFYTLNIAGCIAVAQAALPEPEKCAEAYNAAVQCARESCSYCFASGGTFNQFTECQKAVATKGICRSYENVQGVSCQGYKDANSPALTCFNNGSSETTQVHFTRVVALVCGPT